MLKLRQLMKLSSDSKVWLKTVHSKESTLLTYFFSAYFSLDLTIDMSTSRKTTSTQSQNKIYKSSLQACVTTMLSFKNIMPLLSLALQILLMLLNLKLNFFGHNVANIFLSHLEVDQLHSKQSCWIPVNLRVYGMFVI